MTEWVTDPKVIDIIVALKGLQPGDEIELDPLNSYDLPLGEYYGEVTSIGYPDTGNGCVWENRHRPEQDQREQAAPHDVRRPKRRRGRTRG